MPYITLLRAYLLLIVFEFSYGELHAEISSFCIIAQVQGARPKNLSRSITYSRDREDEVSKLFI